MKRKAKLRSLLLSFYKEMHACFGHRNWWPGESPLEVCVGAVLTQNTAWRNVVKAINNLKAASALDLLRIYEMPHDELSELVRPAGYFNVKARRLGNLVRHIVEKHNGDLDSLFSLPTEKLREDLLSVNGVGKETADSIILYAANQPIFVVDAYTKRILYGHGLINEKADYDQVQELFHSNLPRDTALYNDFHAQFVAVGHHYCKRKPLCEHCPLAKFTRKFPF